MKHNTQTQRSRFPKLLVMLVMIAALVCSFTILASAADEPKVITVSYEDLNIKLDKNAEGIFTKPYDGTDAVAVELKKNSSQLGIDALHDVTVNVTAKFDDKNAGNKIIEVTLSLEGADADKYVLSDDYFTVAAVITPKALTWAGNASVSAIYHPGNINYEVTLSQLPTLNGVLSGEDAGLPASVTATVQSVGATASAITVQRKVELTNPNYTVAPLTVEVNVQKLVITEVEWANEYVFNFGDAAANNIVVYGKDVSGNKYLLKVEYKNSTDGKAYASAPGEYFIDVISTDDNITFAADPDPKKVVINTPEYIVGMNDTVFVGNTGVSQVPSTFMIAVSGINGSKVPADILAKITYTVNGKPFTGASESGTYTVVATLPAGYVFKDADGKTVTSLTANMTINIGAVYAGDSQKPYQVFITGENGISLNTVATVSTPEIPRSALQGFGRYDAYKVAVTGAGEGAYSIILGINDQLIHTDCELLTPDDLYIYDSVSGELVKASEKYVVAVGNGYYKVSGITGDVSLTLVIAPEYHTNFWFTAPGITLLILLVVAIIILIVLMFLSKKKDDEPVEEEKPVEAEEEAVAVSAPVEEDTACEELAEEVAEELTEEVEPVEEPVEEPAVEEEAAEAMEELVAEAEEEAPAEEEAEADAEALAAAVAAAMDESADATDAVALEKEESDEDDDKDDDDDDDNESAGFGGFGGMAGLKFIDINAEPEVYAEMLRQEQAGEVQLVYRYRRSYMSRLIQSQGSVQEYYNIIKNALLAYKGVKARISWNYEAFNRGRVHVAKMNAKTKTLYLYLALDPEELKDTKYGIIDVSSKKKYASVPVLMKIKGDRKFKYALELIEKLCAEQLQLPTLSKLEEVDYTAPYQNTEELVEAGYIKALAAAIPLNPPVEEEVVEEVAEETAPATEAENVTFVEPTDAPAVAAAAEETDESASTEA